MKNEKNFCTTDFKFYWLHKCFKKEEEICINFLEIVIVHSNFLHGVQ